MRDLLNETAEGAASLERRKGFEVWVRTIKLLVNGHSVGLIATYSALQTAARSVESASCLVSLVDS